MGFKAAIKASRPPTTNDVKPGQLDRSGRSVSKDEQAILSSANDPELVNKQPKRSASFGRSFGGLSSIANGLTRKPSSGATTPPGLTSVGTVAPVSNSTMGPPSVPESSHLAQFSLKLSELINKAFQPCSGAAHGGTNGGSTTLAGAAKSAAVKTATAAYPAVPSLSTISYEGKRLPSKSVISELAMLVVAELDYAASVDPYLLRAVSRQALKALTPFADRIDSLVISPSRDPAALQVPTTGKEGMHLPAALEYNLALISLEYIVEDALERCIEGPPGTIDEGMPNFVSEILTPVRKKMEGTILHVLQPILNSAKASFMSTLNRAVSAPFAGYGNSLSPIPSNNHGSSAHVPALGAMSPPIAPSTSAWLRELDGKVDGVRKLLVPRLADRCGQDGEGWFISVVIYVIWKGLFTLTSKSLPVSTALATKYPAALGNPSLQMFAAEVSKRSPSPAQLTSALKSVSVVGRARKPTESHANASGAATPSTVFSTGQSAHTSSAQAGSKATAGLLSDLQGFEKSMRKFASGFTAQATRQSTTRSDGDADSSDSDSDDDDEDELARAALTEALQAVRSTILVAKWLDTEPEAVLKAASRTRGRSVQTSDGSALPADVIRAAKAVPPLLLLHLVYARMPTNLGVFAVQSRPDNASSDPTVPCPPAAFGYTWQDYERAISGFGGGQTWALALAEAWQQDVQEAWVEIQAREGDKTLSSARSNNSSYASDASSKGALAQRSPSLLASDDGRKSDPEDMGKITSLTQLGTPLNAPETGASLDPSESTPTPMSVLHNRVDRASPATSVGGSSESLPEHMTQSAPSLQQQAREGPDVYGSSKAQRGGKERPNWSFIRRKSRKASGSSGSSSPPAPSTPNDSPPPTPSYATTHGHGHDSRATTATPTRRFWRTPSSHSVAGAAAGVQQDVRSNTHALALPGTSALRSQSANSQASDAASQREQERSTEEMRMEMSCLRLLSRALDAVESQRTASVTLADASVQAMPVQTNSTPTPTLTASN